MIYEQIAFRLDKIVDETIAHRIKWRPLEEYNKYYKDNRDLNEYIGLMLNDKNKRLELNKSFIAVNGFSYLVVLYYQCDTEPEVELIGVIHKNASIIKIPPYFMHYSVSKLLDEINTYIEFKKGFYSWETADMFDFLDSFTSNNPQQ